MPAVTEGPRSIRLNTAPEGILYSIVEGNVNRRRHRLRQWRLRGRRGQVSAVATILGLLLVVTYIANYLTTTLPQQMSTNDLNHVVEVENQVGRLQALLEAATTADATGAQFTQPITLGGAGQPPFASADAATIGPATSGSSFNLTMPIGGAFTYTPPKVTTNTHNTPAGCTFTGAPTTGVACTTATTLFWNFTSAVQQNYAISVANGIYFINGSVSGASTAALSVITTGLTGTGILDLMIVGSNDSIPLTITASGTVNVVIVGNYDNLTIADTAAAANVNLTEAGLHDTTWISSAPGITFNGWISGTTDSVTVTKAIANLNAETQASVYFQGDSPSATACPNDDTAISDFVAGGHAKAGGVYYGHYNVTYNVTSTPFTPTTAPPVIWSEYNPSYINLVLSTPGQCPFYIQAATPLYLGALGGGFNVQLANSYLPPADIAFDEGGVIYSQSGGAPIMLDPPAFTATLSSGDLATFSIWFPVFVGTIPVEYGLSTAEISTRLLSVDSITLTPTSSTTIAANSNLNITITSPFAAAWVGWFNTTVPYDTYNFGCTGPTAACNGPYSPFAPLGTVWIDIPTGPILSKVNIQIATFSVSLT